jgi:hypothetical protein
MGFLEFTGAYDATQRNFDRLEALFAAPAQARVYKAAAQVIGTGGGGTACTFDSERWDNASIHSTASNTSRLIAPVTGLYRMGGFASFGPNSTGTRACWIQESAGGSRIAQTEGPGQATNTISLNPSCEWRLAAGQYVELFVYQTSGGNLDVTAEFWIVRLGAYAS